MNDDFEDWDWVAFNMPLMQLLRLYYLTTWMARWPARPTA